MPKWTDEQRLAIDGRAGSLLVSAAAGSGKTTVLVERVIQRLIDTADPCPADKLVIVTFTRAAAANMKQRIEHALTKRIAETGDAWLMKQQLLLQSAKICTIDSFCADIVRENFHLLGISADYSVADKSDIIRFEETAVKKVLSQRYASDNKVFKKLADTVSVGSSDKELENVICSIYSELSSYPFPEKELELLAEPYKDETPISESVWGKCILNEVAEMLRYCIKLMSESLELLSETDEEVQKLADVLAPLINDELEMYKSLYFKAKNGEWDSLYQSVRNLDFGRFTGKSVALEVKEAVKLRRDSAKDIAKNKLRELICVNSNDFNEDRRELRPMIECLVECIKEYGSELRKNKMQSNKFDFGDIEHLALELLVEQDGNSYKKTALAQSLSKTYVEIMVDEYQDTNMLQDMIFSAISNNESNLFFVGDVKQSIYRFRQAMPEIFLGRRDCLSEFKGDNYPARVNLSSNFRSRNGITSAVNFVFSQLMSKNLGEIVYDESEQLNPKASYPQKNIPDVEIRLRNKLPDESEYEHVARYIKQLISQGITVTEGDAVRPVRAGDFCILVRSKKKMLGFAQALENLGIPAECALEGEIGGSAEVRIIISLLQILDNPLQDIYLTAVMMSPVFGFTSTELAKIRVGAARNLPVYRSVVAASLNGDEKCNYFLNKIDVIRKIGIGMGAAEFMRRIFDETDIISIARTLDEPEQRVANLYSLLDISSAFDSSGGSGLSAFLRFLENSGKIESQFEVNEDSNAAKIMNIHKSKGLEFKICILAELSYGLSHKEDRNVIFNRSLGFGMLLRDSFSGKSVLTLPYVACSLRKKGLNFSEEARILYVAMTRAKEKLTIVGTCDYEKILKSMSFAFDHNMRGMDYIYAFYSKTYADWLVPIFARHRDASDFRMLGGNSNSSLVLDSDFSLITRICSEHFELEISEENQEAESSASYCDELLMEELKSRIEYEYPYALLSSAVAKQQASGFLDESFNDEFFASSRPSFMDKDSFTAAQKGTLTHKFMQYCDFSNTDLDAQIDSLINKGIFTQAEANALRKDEIISFFKSDLFFRIQSSDDLMREKKFAMLMPVRDVYPDLPEFVNDENIVVQGMVDLAFVENGEIVIVDYKTDRGADESEIRNRHHNQLLIYAKAMEKCTDFTVKAAYIYSLSLKKEIRVL